MGESWCVMDAVSARRTLVKSRPELWAQLSDAAELARYLGEFGEIRITRLEAERTVAWEGERARGTVKLEPSGWGTRVTLSAELEAAVPESSPEVPEPALPPTPDDPPAPPEPDPPLPAEPFEPPPVPPKLGFAARLSGRARRELERHELRAARLGAARAGEARARAARARALRDRDARMGARAPVARAPEARARASEARTRGSRRRRRSRGPAGGGRAFPPKRPTHRRRPPSSKRRSTASGPRTTAPSRADKRSPGRQAQAGGRDAADTIPRRP